MQKVDISNVTIIKNKIDVSKYNYVGDFHEGLAAVNLDGKYGYINEAGIEVVKPKYDKAFDFQEGLALVELDGKRGVVDKNGNEIIDCCFNSIVISDGMIVFDDEYMVDIKTMQLMYACIFKFNEKTIKKEFYIKDNRDEYLSEVKKYIEEKAEKIKSVKENNEIQITYVDEDFLTDFENKLQLL